MSRNNSSHRVRASKKRVFAILSLLALFIFIVAELK